MLRDKGLADLMQILLFYNVQLIRVGVAQTANIMNPKTIKTSPFNNSLARLKDG